MYCIEFIAFIIHFSTEAIIPVASKVGLQILRIFLLILFDLNKKLKQLSVQFSHSVMSDSLQPHE